jgi:hypothetical protein
MTVFLTGGQQEGEETVVHFADVKNMSRRVEWSIAKETKRTESGIQVAVHICTDLYVKFSRGRPICQIVNLVSRSTYTPTKGTNQCAK